jgi:peroxiredoxin
MAPKRQAQQQRTRAQRRATERAQPRQQPRKQSSGSSRASLIGGIVTVLIVAGIFAYVLFHSSSNSSVKGITNVTAYNPLPNQIAAGTTAPNFTLKDVSGHTYTLSKQRGHPVLLEFFAVWCPVCQAEAPTIAQLTQNYVPKGVRVWSVLSSPYGKNYDSSGRTDTTPATKSDLSWFKQTFNVHHPQLIDKNYTTVNEYGISAYPGLYIIGKNGKILFSQSGHYDYKTLSNELNKALKAKP